MCTAFDTDCAWEWASEDRVRCRRCGFETRSTQGDVRCIHRYCPAAQAENRNEPGAWGDWLARFLSAIGITPQRARRWLGATCGCRRRQEQLNRLGRWAVGLFVRNTR